VHHLRTFGCTVHLKHTRPGLKKLDDRSCKCIFIGYEAGYKAYWCYDPVKRRIMMSWDVMFDEAGKWSWDNNEPRCEDCNEPFTIEYVFEIMHALVHGPGTPSPPASPCTPIGSSPPSSPRRGEHHLVSPWNLPWNRWRMILTRTTMMHLFDYVPCTT
jgi:hypothetical protein